MPDQNSDAYLEYLRNVLEKNKNKNFVKRLLDPNVFPDLDLDEGNRGTHMMSWSDVDGKAVVYPRIVQKPGQRDLTLMSPREAYDYAMSTGEYIPFDDPREADRFGKNYKKLWAGWHTPPLPSFLKYPGGGR